MDANLEVLVLMFHSIVYVYGIRILEKRTDVNEEHYRRTPMSHQLQAQGVLAAVKEELAATRAVRFSWMIPLAPVLAVFC